MVPLGWLFICGVLLREPVGFHADRARAWAAKIDGLCVNHKFGPFGPCTSSGDVGVTGDPPFGWERPGTTANGDSDGDLGLAGGPKNGQMPDKDTFDFPLAQTSPEALETTPGPPFKVEDPHSHTVGIVGTLPQPLDGDWEAKIDDFPVNDTFFRRFTCNSSQAWGSPLGLPSAGETPFLSGKSIFGVLHWITGSQTLPFVAIFLGCKMTLAGRGLVLTLRRFSCDLPLAWETPQGLQLVAETPFFPISQSFPTFGTLLQALDGPGEAKFDGLPVRVTLWNRFTCDSPLAWETPQGLPFVAEKPFSCGISISGVFSWITCSPTRLFAASFLGFKMTPAAACFVLSPVCHCHQGIVNGTFLFWSFLLLLVLPASAICRVCYGNATGCGNHEDGSSCPWSLGIDSIRAHALVGAKANYDGTFFRGLGANPRPGGAPDETGKLAEYSGTIKAFNTKSTRTCTHFSKGTKRTKADIDDRGFCKLNHARDQLVLDKGKYGKCLGNPKRSECDYDPTQRCNTPVKA